MANGDCSREISMLLLLSLVVVVRAVLVSMMFQNCVHKINYDYLTDEEIDTVRLHQVFYDLHRRSGV